jgi:hypothetical protein
MKKALLIPVLMLVVLGLACSNSPEDRAVAVAAPTEAPPPTQKAAPISGLEQELIVLVTGMGERYTGSNDFGEQNCDSDRCVHFNLGPGLNGTSLYIRDGKLEGILGAIDTTDPGLMDAAGVLGEVAGVLVGTYWTPTEQEWDCMLSADVGVTVACGDYVSGSVIDGDMLFIVYRWLFATDANTSVEA